MSAIEMTGLRKTYGSRPVVQDLDLAIEAGECFALLGPNGAGKTTTVEILEGFRSRDAGRVTVLGRDPAKADRAWRARVGIVAQTTGAALDLSVAEAIRHFAAYHAAPRPTNSLLAAVGLTEQAGSRIANLSGGQRRRLDVALGVQGHPEVLFLDEPTTGLDPQARRQLWDLVTALRAEGTTILLTTHYLDEAARLADRVGVIARGRLLEVSPTATFGGELRHSATVRWRVGATPYELVTRTPTTVVRQLLADTPTGEIDDLEIRRPTLEDLYLALIEADDGEPDGGASDGLPRQPRATTGSRS